MNVLLPQNGAFLLEPKLAGTSMVTTIIVVPSTKGKLLIETTEGESVVELKAGQSYYRPVGIEHNVVNANDYEFSFVEIELK